MRGKRSLVPGLALALAGSAWAGAQWESDYAVVAGVGAAALVLQSVAALALDETGLSRLVPALLLGGVAGVLLAWTAQLDLSRAVPAFPYLVLVCGLTLMGYSMQIDRRGSDLSLWVVLWPASVRPRGHVAGVRAVVALTNSYLDLRSVEGDPPPRISIVVLGGQLTLIVPATLMVSPSTIGGVRIRESKEAAATRFEEKSVELEVRGFLGSLVVVTR